MIVPAFVTATLTAFLCGILLRFGYVDFWPVFIAIILGDLVSNIFWYLAGRIGGKVALVTLGGFFGITQEKIDSSIDIFNKYKDIVSFFVSPVIGLGIMLIGLMYAGIKRLPFCKYVAVNTVVGIFWILAILIVGYELGNSYTIFNSIMGRIVTSIGLVIVIFLLMTLGAWVRSLLISKAMRG
jgi:membrane protein DedA with SNARE-associated domain